MGEMPIAIIVIIEVFLFFLGASITSFLEVIIDRVPRGKSPIKGRSMCDNCGHVLGPFELIPVFSYLFLGGKCRHCKTKIPLIYPIKEFCGGLLFAYFGFSYGIKYGISIRTFVLASIMFIFVCVLNVAGSIYLKTEKIGYGSVTAMAVPVIGQIVMKLVYRETSALPLYVLAAFVSVVFFILFGLLNKNLHLSDAIFGFLAGMVLTLYQTLIGLGIAIVILAVCVILKTRMRETKYKKIHYLSYLCLAYVIASMTMLIYK